MAATLRLHRTLRPLAHDAAAHCSSSFASSSRLGSKLSTSSACYSTHSRFTSCSATSTFRPRCFARRGEAVQIVRAFSAGATLLKHGGIPEFLPSSNPELDAVLEQIRTKILLPQHLSPEQERLVYRQENMASLKNDPVYVQIGPSRLRLEHLNRLRHIPSRYKMFNQSIDLAKTRDDWENVVERCMQGYRSARINIQPEWAGAMVRKACAAGMQELVLQACERERKTGLSLAGTAVRNALLAGIRNEVKESGFAEAKAKKALQKFERILTLLEYPEHGSSGRTITTNGKWEDIDARALPYVVALPLEMAAVLAKSQDAAMAKVGMDKTKMYAQRLVAIVKQGELHKQNFICIKLGPVTVIHDSLERALEVLPGDAFPDRAFATTEMLPALKKIIAAPKEAFPSIAKRKKAKLESGTSVPAPEQAQA